MENNHETLLAFDTVPFPDPVRMGGNGGITIFVQNKSDDIVYCSDISFTFVVGTTDSALFAHNPLSHSESEDWTSLLVRKSRLSNQVEEWTVSFSCTKEPRRLIDYSFSFTIYGEIADAKTSRPYPYRVQIAELSKKNGDDYTWKETGYNGVRTKQDFYLKNFCATHNDAQNMLIAEISRNEPFRLSWDSNGGAYQVYAGNPLKSVYKGMQSTFVLEEGIADDTVFLLDATLASDYGFDVNLPQGASEQHLYAYLPVKVTNPDISVNSVHVLKQITANSANVSLFGGSAQVLVAGSLSKPNEYVSKSDGFLLMSAKVSAEGEVEMAAVCENREVRVKASYPSLSVQNAILPVTAGKTLYISSSALSFGQGALFQWFSLGKAMQV